MSLCPSTTRSSRPGSSPASAKTPGWHVPQPGPFLSWLCAGIALCASLVGFQHIPPCILFPMLHHQCSAGSFEQTGAHAPLPSHLRDSMPGTGSLLDKTSHRAGAALRRPESRLWPRLRCGRIWPDGGLSPGLSKVSPGPRFSKRMLASERGVAWASPHPGTRGLVRGGCAFQFGAAVDREETQGRGKTRQKQGHSGLFRDGRQPPV